MRVWLYCISNEVHSCNKLGIIRKEVIKFASERSMNVYGITSVNCHQSIYIEDMMVSVVNKKAQALVINNIEFLSDRQQQLLHNLCNKNKVNVIYATCHGGTS